MRGRKKPIEQKKLEGTFRKGDHPKNPFIPEKLDGVLEPPKDFDKKKDSVAINIWNGTIKELYNNNILYAIDMPLFKIYCQEYQNYHDAIQKIKELGSVIEYTNKAKETNLVPNPYIAVKSKSWDIIRELSKRFGLTPTDRNSMEIPEKKDDQNPLGNILNR